MVIKETEPGGTIFSPKDQTGFGQLLRMACMCPHEAENLQEGETVTKVKRVAVME